jgi:hypothetical protein
MRYILCLAWVCVVLAFTPRNGRRDVDNPNRRAMEDASNIIQQYWNKYVKRESELEFLMDEVRPVFQENWSEWSNRHVRLTDRWTGKQFEGKGRHGSDAWVDVSRKYRDTLRAEGNIAIGWAGIHWGPRHVSAWCCAVGRVAPLGAILWYQNGGRYTIIDEKWANEGSEPEVNNQCRSNDHRVSFVGIPDDIPIEQVRLTCVGSIDSDDIPTRIPHAVLP